MRFSYGATRFVFIGDQYVLKIARIRPFRVISRLVHWGKKGEVRARLGRFDKESMIVAGMKYLLAGFRANMIEARLYRDYKHLPLAPTVFSLWLFNIQRKAEPITKEESWMTPFRDLAERNRGDSDLWKLAHYGKIDGEIYFIDYGGPEFERILRFHYPTARPAPA